MNKNEDPIWITEADVVSVMHLGEAIDALEAGLRLEASGAAQNMVKTQAVWGGKHTLHAIGATFEGSGFVGTKTWAHTAGGATPLLVLWDSETGKLKTIIEAFALGQMRTGAMSGVAARTMAAPDAGEMAIIGTGKQALTQVAAVCAVRPIKRVRVYSPTQANRAAFAEKIRKADLVPDVVESTSVEDCVKDAPIVTLVTRANEPFLTTDMVAPGTHINAVGSISPEREEFTQDIFPRCAVLAGDSVPNIKLLSKEFKTYFKDGNWDAVKPICQLVGADATRPDGADLTLFKAMGMGISDLSLGVEIFRRAEAASAFRAMPHPVKVPPRLKAS